MYSMWINRQFPPVLCRQRHNATTGYASTIPPLYLARRVSQEHASEESTRRPLIWHCGSYEVNVPQIAEHKSGPFRVKDPGTCRFTAEEEPGGNNNSTTRTQEELS